MSRLSLFRIPASPMRSRQSASAGSKRHNPQTLGLFPGKNSRQLFVPGAKWKHTIEILLFLIWADDCILLNTPSLVVCFTLVHSGLGTPRTFPKFSE